MAATPRRRRLGLGVLAAGLGLLLAGASSALTLEGISLHIDATSSAGSSYQTFDGTQLAGSGSPDTDPSDGTLLLREGDLDLTEDDLVGGGDGYTYYGPTGDWKLSDWELDIVADPFLGALVGVANLSSQAQTFDIVLDVPVAPVVPASLLNGSVATLLDLLIGTISDDGSSPLYVGRLDGSELAGTELVPAPFSSSTSVPSGSFAGLVGPPVAGSIGIRWRFELAPFSAALFTSSLNVVAVPEPGTLVLVALGLAAGAAARRRTR